ncbi:MAG: diguanylate cyclase, partial [Anaerolineae bacterium]
LMAETHHGFPEWGWYGTKFAVMLALGQDVPPTFDIRPRTMYKSNADLFYPTPALEPIDWEGIKAGRKLPQKIVIGWAPAAVSGVYQTATEYFEKAAAEARQHGINVEVITRTPATHVDFADQVAIIEDYIQRQVDVIVISAIEVEVIRQTIKKANQAGIPVIIVNQLEPIEGVKVASYIGFDNTVVGAISAYAVVDYLGGPGILGKGDRVKVEPGTHLDLAWWQALYKDVDPRAMEVKGRVAIIEGISGSWHGENRLVRSDGSVIYADSITFPVHDEAGQFMGLVASFRDATQRKQAEEALRKAHDELEIRVEERTAELARTNKELQAEITERKRAEEKIEHLDLVLRAIRNVNQLITREKDRDRLLQGVCETLTETRGYHSAWIALLDESEGRVTTAEARLGEDFSPVVRRLKDGELTDCGQRALKQSGVVVTKDPASTCAGCPLSSMYGDRGAMTVRLEYGGKVYGLLSISIPGDLAADEEERALFEEVAGDIAFALHSIEQEEAAKRRAAQAALVYEVGQRVSSKLELGELLSEIVPAVRDAFDYYGVMILLVDEEANRLTMQSIAGGYADIFPRDLYHAIGEGMTGYAAASGQTQVSGDVSKDPHYVREVDEETRSELAVPVKSGEKVIGVLDIQSDEFDAFDETDVMLMETLADQIAGAIENARLYEAVQQELAERKRAEEALRVSEERFALAVQGSSDGLFDWDIQNHTLYWSPRLKEMLGYADDELDVDFDTLTSHLHPDDKEHTNAAIESHLKDRVPFNVEQRLRTKSGEYRWFHTRGQALWDEAGNSTRMTGHTSDITERKRTEEELAYMATHDALTGLPNRWLFNDRLTLELARAYRNRQKLAVMLLDLDYFKDVNDTLGHTVGDRLLQVVGKRLISLVRKSDTVARMGGDEFMLLSLFPGIRGEEDAARIAERILEVFRRPFVLDGHEIRITTSIGIAIYPDDGQDTDTLMKNADIAMYRAKERGRDNYQHYSGRGTRDRRGREPVRQPFDVAQGRAQDTAS